MLLGARQMWRGGEKLPYDAEVEYLESTGIQWIDTGIPGNSYVSMLKVSTKVWITSFSYSREWSIAGAKLLPTRNIGWTLFGANNSRDQRSWVVDGSTWGNMFDHSLSEPTEFSVTFNKPTGRVCEVVGGASISNPYANNNFTSTTGNVALLIDNTNNDRTYTSQLKAKLYYFRMMTDGVLVCDLQPVRFTNENGVTEGAMFDRANPTVGMNPDGSARDDGLYRNRGTGAFVIGPDKT